MYRVNLQNRNICKIYVWSTFSLKLLFTFWFVINLYTLCKKHLFLLYFPVNVPMYRTVIIFYHNRLLEGKGQRSGVIIAFVLKYARIHFSQLNLSCSIDFSCRMLIQQQNGWPTESKLQFYFQIRFRSIPDFEGLLSLPIFESHFQVHTNLRIYITKYSTNDSRGNYLQILEPKFRDGSTGHWHGRGERMSEGRSLHPREYALSTES